MKTKKPTRDPGPTLTIKGVFRANPTRNCRKEEAALYRRAADLIESGALVGIRTDFLPQDPGRKHVTVDVWCLDERRA